MRHPTAHRFAPVIIALAALAPALAPPARAAESTRTIRVELPAAEAARFVVENLAGVMKVVPGKGPGLVAVATVHAESDDLLGRVRFERVTTDQRSQESGWPTLRVRYPLDEHATIRYSRGEEGGSSLLQRLFDGSHSNVRYDGRRVTVGARSGVLLYADVTIEVPPGEVEASFRNLFGLLRGHGLSGRIRFDTNSGDVILETLRGSVTADTGSGDVRATGVEGSFRCDTGSGDCRIADLHGEELFCDAGSGDITARGIAARRVRGDTGSGNVAVLDADLEELVADTGSGNVVLEARSVARLARVKADTGSGNVTLRLGPDASFEAIASQGSGDITNRYADARPIVKHKQVIGYRRGEGTIRIEVDTGSGDLTLDPSRVSAGRDRSGEPGSTRSR